MGALGCHSVGFENYGQYYSTTTAEEHYQNIEPK